MTTLSRLCERVATKLWPQIWEQEAKALREVMLTEAVHEAAEHQAVYQRCIMSQLFFVIRNDEASGRLEIPAGYGPSFDYWRTQITGMPLVEPMACMFNEDVKPGDMHVIQDFQGWWEKLSNPNPEFERARSTFVDTGSWVAVRLPDVSGYEPALLVAHFCVPAHAANAMNKNLLTHELLHFLRVTVKRIQAPFLLALSENQQRNLWAALVVHEMKNLALMAQDALVKGEKATLTQLLAYQSELSQDFLFSLRPAHSKPALCGAQTVNVSAVLEQSLNFWNHEDTGMSVNVDLLQNLVVSLVEPQIWQRILRVLLHNAFRHGRDWVYIEMQIQRESEEGKLLLRVANGASSTSLEQLPRQGNRYHLDVDVAYLRRHLGLQTAMSLCEEYRGGLKIEPNKEKNQVTMELVWPLGDEKQVVP